MHRSRLLLVLLIAVAAFTLFPVFTTSQIDPNTVGCCSNPNLYDPDPNLNRFCQPATFDTCCPDGTTNCENFFFDSARVSCDNTKCDVQRCCETATSCSVEAFRDCPSPPATFHIGAVSCTDATLTPQCIPGCCIFYDTQSQIVSDTDGVIQKLCTDEQAVANNAFFARFFPGTVCSDVGAVGTGTIQGRVTVNGQPVQGAVVEATLVGISTTTSATGTYSLLSVAVGDQTIEASYTDPGPPVVVYVPVSQTVTVTEGGIFQNINFDLTATADTAIVAGAVTDKRGNPITTAAVSWVEGNVIVGVDETGSYLISNVVDCQTGCTFTASALWFLEQSQTFTVSPGVTQRINFELTPEVVEVACGNDVQEAGEACDGPDAAACPTGLCIPAGLTNECTCANTCDDIQGSCFVFPEQCPGNIVAVNEITTSCSRKTPPFTLADATDVLFQGCCQISLADYLVCPNGIVEPDKKVSDTQIPPAPPPGTLTDYCLCGKTLVDFSSTSPYRSGYCCGAGDSATYSSVPCVGIQGTVEGFVFDTDGYRITDATLDFGAGFTTVSSGVKDLLEGYFAITLPAGTYDVTASNPPRYKTQIIPDIIVEENRITTVPDIILEIRSTECDGPLPAPITGIVDYVPGIVELTIFWTQTCLSLDDPETNQPIPIVSQFVVSRDGKPIGYVSPTIDIRPDGSFSFKDVGADIGGLEWNRYYTYKIDVQALDPTAHPDNLATIDIYSGDALCAADGPGRAGPPPNEFCINDRDKTLASPSQEVTGMYEHLILDPNDPTYPRTIRAYCNPKNVILIEQDCVAAYGANSLCIGPADGSTSCKQPIICELKSTEDPNVNYKNPFGLFYNREECLYKNVPAIIPEDRNYCYYDYYEQGGSTPVDSCLNCRQDGFCYDYSSKDACEADNCFYGPSRGGYTCAWQDSVEFGEVGKGFCFAGDDQGNPTYVGTEFCGLCSADNPLFSNIGCTQEVCTLLGSCYSQNDASCESCGANVACEDYSDEVSCTGGAGGAGTAFSIDARTDTSFSNDLAGADCGSSYSFTDSNDVCEITLCQWDDAVGCFKDGDSDTAAECISSAGVDRSCAQDKIAPSTTLSNDRPSAINNQGATLRFLTSSDTDRLYYCINGPNELNPCCPIYEVAVQTSTDPLVPSGYVINLPNTEYDLLTANGEEYTISYYANDSNHNAEKIKSEQILVDLVPPTIAFSFLDEHHQEDDFLSNLTVTMTINEYATCSDTLTRIVQNGDLPIHQFVGMAFQPPDFIEEETYRGLKDGNYKFKLDCTDAYGNQQTHSEIYLIDRIKRILVAEPNEVTLATDLVDLHVETSDDYFCRFKTTETEPYQFFNQGITTSGSGLRQGDVFIYDQSVILQADDYVVLVECASDIDFKKDSIVDTATIHFKVDTAPPVTDLLYREFNQFVPFDADLYYSNEDFMLQCTDKPEIRTDLDRPNFECDQSKYCITIAPTCVPTTTDGNPFRITNPSGTYNLCYSSSDKGGNVATPTCSSVQIDRDPPDVVITDPADQDIFIADSIVVSGTYVDVHSGVIAVTIRVVNSDGDEASFDSTVIPSANPAIGDFVATSVILSEGENMITAVARDRAGNEKDSDTIVVYWDTTPPIVADPEVRNHNDVQIGDATSPTLFGEYGKNLSFSVAATDEFSDIGNVRVRIACKEGLCVGNPTVDYNLQVLANRYQFNLTRIFTPATILESGLYSATFTATDTVNLEGIPTSVDFEVKDLLEVEAEIISHNTTKDKREDVAARTCDGRIGCSEYGSSLTLNLSFFDGNDQLPVSLFTTPIAPTPPEARILIGMLDTPEGPVEQYIVITLTPSSDDMYLNGVVQEAPDCVGDATCQLSPGKYDVNYTVTNQFGSKVYTFNQTFRVADTTAPLINMTVLFGDGREVVTKHQQGSGTRAYNISKLGVGSYKILLESNEPIIREPTMLLQSPDLLIDPGLFTVVDPPGLDKVWESAGFTISNEVPFFNLPLTIFDAMLQASDTNDVAVSSVNPPEVAIVTKGPIDIPIFYTPEQATIFTNIGDYKITGSQKRGNAGANISIYNLSVEHDPGLLEWLTFADRVFNTTAPEETPTDLSTPIAAGIDYIEVQDPGEDIAVDKYLEFNTPRLTREFYKITKVDDLALFFKNVSFSPSRDSAGIPTTVRLYTNSAPTGWFGRDTILTQGTNQFRLAEVDDVGNFGILSEVRKVILDTLPPEFVMPVPTDGSFLNNNKSAVTITVKDNYAVEEDSITCEIDGLPNSCTANCVADECSVQFSTSDPPYSSRRELSSAAHTAKVSASDLAGNQGSFEWAFTVDPNVPNKPELTVIPSNLVDDVSYTNDATPSFEILFTDETQQISLDSLEISSRTASQDLTATIAQPDPLVFRFTANVPQSLADGTYTLTIRARKQLDTGLMSNAGEYTYEILVDTVAPTLTITDVTPSNKFKGIAHTNQNPIGILGDSDEDLIELSFSDGVEPLTFADADLDAIFDSRNNFVAGASIIPPDGVKTILAQGSDLAGNTGQATFSIMYDTTPPVFTLDDLPDYTNQKTINITGDGELNTKFTLFINGVEKGKFSLLEGESSNSESVSIINLQFDAEELDLFVGAEFTIANQDAVLSYTISGTGLAPVTLAPGDSTVLLLTTEQTYNIIAEETVSLAQDQLVVNVKAGYLFDRKTLTPGDALCGPTLCGPNNIIVRAEDLAGNTARLDDAIYLDVTEPVIENPRPTGTIADFGPNEVTLTATLKDEYLMQEGTPVDVTVGTGRTSVVQDSITTSNCNAQNDGVWTCDFSYVIQVELENKKTYTVELSFADAAGNSIRRGTWSFSTDNNTPRYDRFFLNPSYKANNFYTNSTEPELTFKFLDDVDTSTASLLTSPLLSIANSILQIRLLTYFTQSAGASPYLLTVKASRADGLGIGGSYLENMVVDLQKPSIVNPTPTPSLVLAPGGYSLSKESNLILDFDVIEENEIDEVVIDGSRLSNLDATGHYSGSVRLSSNQQREFAISATDKAGNTERISLLVEFDSGITQPKITFPPRGYKTNNQQILVNGTYQDRYMNSLLIAGDVSPEVFVGNLVSSDDLQNFSESVTLDHYGTNRIFVNATDLVRNYAESTPLDVVFDDRPPELDSLTPAEGDSMRTIRSVEAVLTEPDWAAGVASTSTIELFADGVPITGTANVRARGSSATLRFTPSPEIGDQLIATITTINVVINAVDNLGNEATYPSTFLINKDAPLVEILSPVPNTYTNDENITVLASVSSDKTLSSIMLSAPPYATVNVTDLLNAGSLLYDLELKSSTTRITITATDELGNQGVASREIILDKKPPSISLDKTPDFTNTPQFTITGDARDDTLLADPPVLLTVDDIPYSVNFDSSSGTFSSTVQLEEGINNFEATAFDKAGNSKSVKATIILDTDISAPIVDDIKPLIKLNERINVLGQCDLGSTVSMFVNDNLASGDTYFIPDYPASQDVVLTSSGITPSSLVVNTGAQVTFHNTLSVPATLAYDTVTIDIPANDEASVTLTSSIAYTMTTPTASFNGIVTVEPLPNTFLFKDVFLGNSRKYTARSGNSYDIVISCKDVAGNEAFSDKQTVIYDPEAPILESFQPAGTIHKISNVEITGTILDNYRVDPDALVNVTVAGRTASLIPQCTDVRCSFSYIIPDMLQDRQTYGVTVKYKDLAGNPSSSSWSFKVDVSTPPTPVFRYNGVIFPDGFQMPTSEPNLAVEFSQVVFLENIAIDGAPVPYDTNNNRAFTFNPTLDPGLHRITVTARKRAEFETSGEYVRTFYIDTAAPIIDIEQPDESPEYTNSRSIEVSGKVVNEDYTTLDWIKVNERLVGDKNSNAFSQKVYLTEGLNIINVSARDKAGYYGSATTEVIYDRTPPVISISTATQSPTNIETITITGNVNEQSIVDFLINGQSQAKLQANGDFVADLIMTPGLNIIEAVAEDLAGNTKTSNKLTITYDNILPEAFDFTPGGIIGEQQPLISARVEDDSGIASVTMQVNGQDVTSSFDGTTVSFTPGIPLADLTDHNVLISFTDNAGNSNTASWSFRVDQTVPVFLGYTINNQPMPYYVNDAQPQIGFSFTEPVNLVYVVQGSKDGTLGEVTNQVLTTDNQNFVFTPTRPFRCANRGECQIEVSASSLVTAGRYPKDFVVDTIPPNLRDLSRLPALTGIQNNTIKGTVVETYLDRIFVDNQNDALPEFAADLNTISSPNTYEKDVSLVSADNRITVRALDRAGNSAEYQIDTFYDDLVPRITAITDVTNSIRITDVLFKTKQRSATVTGTYTSNDNVKIYLTDNTRVRASVNTAASTFTIRPSLATSTGEEVENIIDLTIEDSVGNKGTFQFTIITDTKAPQITITKPRTSATNNPSPTVEFTVSERATEVILQESTTGTRQEWMLSSTNLSYQYTFSGLSEGDYPMSVTATDALGNKGTASVVLTIDFTPPVIQNVLALPGRAKENLGGFSHYLVTLPGQTLIEYVTNEETRCFYAYDGVTDKFPGYDDYLFSSDKVSNPIPNLVSGTNYTFVVSCEDRATNPSATFEMKLEYNLDLAVDIFNFRPSKYTNQRQPLIAVSTDINATCETTEESLLTTLLPLFSGFVSKSMDQTPLVGHFDYAYKSEKDLEDGKTYRFTVRCTDAQGTGRGDGKETFTVIADFTPPDPPVLDPIPTPTIAKYHTISGVALEPNLSVELYVNGVLDDDQEVTGDDGKFKVFTVRLETGDNVITARLIDLAGNVGDFSDPISVFYDTTGIHIPAPSTPGDGDVLPEPLDPVILLPVNPPVTGFPNGTEINVTVSVNGTVIPGIVILQNDTIGFIPEDPSVPSGTMNITIIIKDPITNRTTNTSLTITIDPAVPSIQLTTLRWFGTASTTTVIDFEGTITANTGLMDTAVLRVGTLPRRTLFRDADIVSEPFAAAVSVSTDGRYKFSITAQDTNGNVAIRRGLFVVDSIGPEVCIEIGRTGVCKIPVGVVLVPVRKAYRLPEIYRELEELAPTIANVTPELVVTAPTADNVSITNATEPSPTGALVCGDGICQVLENCIADCTIPNVAGYQYLGASELNPRDSLFFDPNVSYTPSYQANYQLGEEQYTVHVLGAPPDPLRIAAENPVSDQPAEVITFGDQRIYADRTFFTVAFWPSHEKVGIVLTTDPELPQGLIAAYLEKYPSTVR